jgi:hypothetical protein
MTFATGFSPEGTVPMNYNLYFGQVDFINEQGDTLQIKPSQEITIISIGHDRYFYDESVGYLKLLQQGQLSFGRYTLYALEKMEYVSGSNNTNEWRVDRRGAMSSSDRYYKKKATYYFIDPNNKVRKPTRHNLRKIFPSKRLVIRNYVNKHAVNFQNESDLRALVTFCNQLMTIE